MVSQQGDINANQVCRSTYDRVSSRAGNLRDGCRRYRGMDAGDERFMERELNAVKRQWKSSPAMPPDLLQRAAFTCETFFMRQARLAHFSNCGPGLCRCAATHLAMVLSVRKVQEG